MNLLKNIISITCYISATLAYADSQTTDVWSQLNIQLMNETAGTCVMKDYVVKHGQLTQSVPPGSLISHQAATFTMSPIFTSIAIDLYYTCGDDGPIHITVSQEYVKGVTHVYTEKASHSHAAVTFNKERSVLWNRPAHVGISFYSD